MPATGRSSARDRSLPAALRDAACNLGLANVEELTKSIWLLFHACTIGDNSLITRMGAKTGLITTRGFEDTVLVMR